MRKEIIFFLFLFLFSFQLILYSESYSSICIRTKVPMVKIYIDGNFKGFSDQNGIFCSEALPVGKYTFRFEKNGYQTMEKSIIIKELTEEIVVELQPLRREPEPVSPHFESYLDIIANISEADVYLDGVLKGRTNKDGSFHINTTPGEHLIEVKKSGYLSHSEKLKLSPGLTMERKVYLYPTSKVSSDDIIIKILAGILAFLVLLTGIVVLKVTGIIGKPQNRFDRYILYEVIGRGGMATIYKAKDTVEKKTIALKIMDYNFLTDKDLMEKFIREGHGISMINESFPEAPVVRVLRFGRENNSSYGRPFIAMELLNGPTLLDLIRDKKNFDLRFIIKIIFQIAIALKAAHSKGIFHRDVTPDNVILTRNDQLNPECKLIDFGVARHEYTSAGTLDGSIAGKPPYMSPEQCKGEKVDARSDIYSLGIIFYTLLKGNPPFVSNNPLEVMFHHENTPIPPLPESVPENTRKIVEKMLKKDKKERYRDVEEFLEELSQVFKEESSQGKTKFISF